MTVGGQAANGAGGGGGSETNVNVGGASNGDFQMSMSILNNDASATAAATAAPAATAAAAAAPAAYNGFTTHRSSKAFQCEYLPVFQTKAHIIQYTHALILPNFRIIRYVTQYLYIMMMCLYSMTLGNVL